MEWYISALKKYATFDGRSRRKEYWMFTLINFIIGFVLGFIDAFAFEEMAILSFVYSIAMFVPGLALSVRRLHDIGKSGWWLLLALIPLVGGIILLVWYCTDSQNDNKFGPNPKQINVIYGANYH